MGGSWAYDAPDYCFYGESNAMTLVQDDNDWRLVTLEKALSPNDMSNFYRHKHR